MLEAMACARPIVLGVDGEARKLAERQAGAAIAVEPENAYALISAILHLYEHPDQAELLGQRGRVYVEAHFDYEQLVATLDERISILLGNGAAVSTSKILAPGLTPVEQSHY